MARLEHAPHNRCGWPTIAGWSGPPSGMQVRVDAAPLNPEQELAAVAAGVRTYVLLVVPDELHPRTAGQIRNRPAGGTPRQTVHAEHRCPHLPPGVTT